MIFLPSFNRVQHRFSIQPTLHSNKSYFLRVYINTVLESVNIYLVFLPSDGKWCQSEMFFYSTSGSSINAILASWKEFVKGVCVCVSLMSSLWNNLYSIVTLWSLKVLQNSHMKLSRPAAIFVKQLLCNWVYLGFLRLRGSVFGKMYFPNKMSSSSHLLWFWNFLYFLCTFLFFLFFKLTHLIRD